MRTMLLAVLVTTVCLFWAGGAGAETLAGVVVDRSDRPLAEARVWLVRAAWGQQPALSRTTRTDAAGRFSFADLPVETVDFGSYSVCALAPGHALAWAGSLAPRPDVRLVLEPEFALRGLLLDPKGAPVPGVTPRLTSLERGHGFDPLEIGPLWDYCAPPEELSALLVAPSGADGLFTVSHLPAGTELSLQVVDERFARRDDDLPWTELMSGKPFGIRLDQAGAIRGRVVRAADNTPVAGAKVGGKIGNDLGEVALADANGRYELKGLMPGIYLVYLGDDPTTRTAAAVGGVQVAPGAIVEAADLKVVPGLRDQGHRDRQGNGRAARGGGRVLQHGPAAASRPGLAAGLHRSRRAVLPAGAGGACPVAAPGDASGLALR